MSLQWDETYVELLVTASKLKSQIAYAKEQEPSQVDMLERKMSRYFQFLCSFNEGKTRKWFTKLVTAVYGVKKNMLTHQSRLEGSKNWPTSTAGCFI